MKVVFAGPSIYGAILPAGDYEIRAPARQGDLLIAVEQGATAIGLIDGWFGSAASVWHKEIMFALARGVAVCGASSMGALRAAECARYGMVPVGSIAHDYLEGRLDDDAAVALTMGPAELDYMPLVEPLVDVWPTIGALLQAGRVSADEAVAMKAAAEAIFYQDRTVDAIVAATVPRHRRQQLAADYERHRVPQKSIDAIELLDMFCQPVAWERAAPSWEFNPSPFWSFPAGPAHASLTATVVRPP